MLTLADMADCARNVSSLVVSGIGGFSSGREQTHNVAGLRELTYPDQARIFFASIFPFIEGCENPEAGVYLTGLLSAPWKNMLRNQNCAHEKRQQKMCQSGVGLLSNPFCYRLLFFLQK